MLRNTTSYSSAPSSSLSSASAAPFKIRTDRRGARAASAGGGRRGGRSAKAAAATARDAHITHSAAIDSPLHLFAGLRSGRRTGLSLAAFLLIVHYKNIGSFSEFFIADALIVIETACFLQRADDIIEHVLTDRRNLVC